MKVYFPEILDDAKAHALREYPKESCGLVVNNKYIPCRNNYSELEGGRLDVEDYIAAEELGEIQAFIHSHDNYPHASKADMIEQLNTGIPWGIINIQSNVVQDIFFWGDTLPVQDYVGRQFFHGVYDCFNLGRDWYRNELGIIIPQVPREYGWWYTGENLIEENILNIGFEIVGNGRDLSIIKPGDGILAKVNSKVVNHTGVYVGDGLILHHICLHKNSLSRREPINSYRDFILYIVRHRNFK